MPGWCTQIVFCSGLNCFLHRLHVLVRCDEDKDGGMGEEAEAEMAEMGEWEGEWRDWMSWRGNLFAWEFSAERLVQVRDKISKKANQKTWINTPIPLTWTCQGTTPPMNIIHNNVQCNCYFCQIKVIVNKVKLFQLSISNQYVFYYIYKYIYIIL